MTKEWKDKLKGGLSDNKKPSDFDSRLISDGLKVEMEHTNDIHLATEIVMDHLMEDLQYYKKLKTIEKAEEWFIKKEDDYEVHESHKLPKGVKVPAHHTDTNNEREQSDNDYGHRLNQAHTVHYVVHKPSKKVVGHLGVEEHEKHENKVSSIHVDKEHRGNSLSHKLYNHAFKTHGKLASDDAEAMESSAKHIWNKMKSGEHKGKISQTKSGRYVYNNSIEKALTANSTLVPEWFGDKKVQNVSAKSDDMPELETDLKKPKKDDWFVSSKDKVSKSDTIEWYEDVLIEKSTGQLQFHKLPGIHSRPDQEVKQLTSPHSADLAAKVVTNKGKVHDVPSSKKDTKSFEGKVKEAINAPHIGGASISRSDSKGVYSAPTSYVHADSKPDSTSHEAVHHTFSEISNKHKLEPHHMESLHNHFLNHFHKDDIKHIKRQMSRDGYSKKDPSYKEEMIAHVHNHLSSPSRKPKVGGFDKTRLRNSWNMARSTAKHMTPDILHEVANSGVKSTHD